MRSASANHIKDKYRVLQCVPSLTADIWVQDGQVHYDWDYHLNPKDKITNAISHVTSEELDCEIDKLVSGFEARFDEYTFDPCIYQLELIDRNGRKHEYRWCDDDRISETVRRFIAFLEEKVGTE